MHDTTTTFVERVEVIFVHEVVRTYESQLLIGVKDCKSRYARTRNAHVTQPVITQELRKTLRVLSVHNLQA